MATRNIIIMAVLALVITTCVIGFYITLDVSPQIAYARLFIDAGLAIGLVAVILSLYKEKQVYFESLISAINLLKNGKYDVKITEKELGVLEPLAKSINELGKKLLEKEEKQEEIKRSLREELLPKFKPKEVMLEQHSIHPELGPVLPINANEPIINNTLVDSNPPSKVKTPSIHPLDEVNQDLGELYQRFVDAQKAKSIEQIEYSLFLKTIEKSKKDIMAEYNCSDVFFDVAFQNNEVALQPKILR